jgi:hypothetical protein
VSFSRRLVASIGVVVILAATAWIWRACTETDEAKILRVIDKGRQAIEDKSLRRAMAVLAPDYHDNLGFTAQSVRPILQRLFFGVEGLRIEVLSQSLPVMAPSGEPRTATVTLAVAVSGGVQGQPVYLMGMPSAPAVVTITLRQDGRRWLISGVTGLMRPQLE